MKNCESCNILTNLLKKLFDKYLCPNCFSIEAMQEQIKKEKDVLVQQQKDRDCLREFMFVKK